MTLLPSLSSVALILLRRSVSNLAAFERDSFLSVTRRGLGWGIPDLLRTRLGEATGNPDTPIRFRVVCERDIPVVLGIWVVVLRSVGEEVVRLE